MRIRSALWVAGAAALAIAPASYTEAQVAGNDLAMDFRMTTWAQGDSDSGVVTGHSVVSGSKMRTDMVTVGGRAPTPFPTDGPVSIIVSDSGKTFTYLDTKKSQYMRFRPEMIAQAQQVAGVTMEFSETAAKVDNLGAGPRIQGRRTSHYRVSTAMTMTTTFDGARQQSTRIESTTDLYYPSDLRSAFNPFAGITGSDMLSVLASDSQEFTAKMKAVEAKLPKSTPLRTSTTATITSQGVTRVTKSNTEVTSVQWVNADPKVFEIPAGYTAVELPEMGGPPPDP